MHERLAVILADLIHFQFNILHGHFEVVSIFNKWQVAK